MIRSVWLAELLSMLLSGDGSKPNGGSGSNFWTLFLNQVGLTSTFRLLLCYRRENIHGSDIAQKFSFWLVEVLSHVGSFLSIERKVLDIAFMYVYDDIRRKIHFETYTR